MGNSVDNENMTERYQDRYWQALIQLESGAHKQEIKDLIPKRYNGLSFSKWVGKMIAKELKRK